MPIHLRADKGAYAPNVLCPGDPRRARWIAETFLDDATCVNEERGLLGFTGTYQGAPLSVQATGMGCPTTAIVGEELIRLGARRLVRVGTCGALRSPLQLGDVIIAQSAAPADTAAVQLVQGEAHAPTASFAVLERLVAETRAASVTPNVGSIVSASLFYDPDSDRIGRWAAAGNLGVEMEAALLFTLAALRGVEAGCILAVSDTLWTESFERIDDDTLARAVETVTEIACRAAIAA